jgi:hypothetical protein
MSPDEWHLSGSRPYNSPLRRLAAMSYLITRYRREGLLAGLWGCCVVNALSVGDWHRMEEGLVVNADDYWGCHFDFDSGSLAASPAVVGEGRAADIMVNVLLPFTHACGQRSGWPDLASAAIGAYRAHHGLADNALLKHMRSQLRIGRHLVSSARRQQGLLQIYRTLCTQGGCESCPLIASGRDGYAGPVMPAVNQSA